MKCPNCGYQGAPNSTFCEACGLTLEARSGGPALPLAGGAATVGLQPPDDLSSSGWERLYPRTGDGATELPHTACGCGAPPSAMDAEGICANCGAIRAVKRRDHFAVGVSRDIAVVSDIGRVHRRNEDYGVVVVDTGSGAPSIIFAVCDGVSTSENSDTASENATRAAIRAMQSALRGGQSDGDAVVLAAIDAAQSAVLAVPFPAGSSLDPPEATIVCGFIRGGILHCGWAGDSRLYLLSEDAGTVTASLLTEDDSWINAVVRAGQMTYEQAATDARSHGIVQCLGPVADGAPFTPHTLHRELAAGARLLACSDGFWNYAHPRQNEPPHLIADMMRDTRGDALALAGALTDFARDQGGHDNITVLLVLNCHTEKEK